MGGGVEKKCLYIVVEAAVFSFCQLLEPFDKIDRQAKTLISF